MNYLKRIVREPKVFPGDLVYYDYRTIKKFQKNSGLRNFAEVIFIALISQIVFLFLSLIFSNYANEQVKNDLINSIASFSKAIGLKNINILVAIFYLPIALTITSIIWRAKNYLLNELSLDIETSLDKLFLYFLIPILFSAATFCVFSIYLYELWFVFCALCFFITFIITLTNFVAVSKGNKYRIAIPRRNDGRIYTKTNKYGFRHQIYRWMWLLAGWTSLTAFFGISLFLLIHFVLISNDTKIMGSINMCMLIGINYVSCTLTCLLIHNFTYLSKSVQPSCIESYEKEINEVIKSMNFKREGNQDNLGVYKWPLIKLQYRAIQHLRNQDVRDKKLNQWYDKIKPLVEK